MGLTFPPSGGIDSAQTGSTQLGSTSSIMKFFLLAAALLGLSGALQPGFEYKYMYRGRVALGIPSISSQISTSAFYADAKVQVVDATELRIQFSNIFIGDMNSRVTCEDKLTQADGYTQIEYAPLEQYKDQLETPFAVKLTDNQVKPYQFPDSDVVWVRNIRRAFVHVLHIPTNAPNIGQSAISNSPSFNRMESHPLGECPAMYTVTPMKEHLLQFYKPDPLETDAQGDIEDTYWRLSKSVDFDNCVDMVSSHTFGTMLPGKYDNDKCGEEYLSTATTGFYTLKGGPRGVRIEKAVQEGTYVIDHDNVHFYSNQTLDLRSVDPVAAPFDVSGSFYSFRHEMDAFSWQSEKSSGSNIDKESVIGEIKSYAKQRFQEGADALKTGQPFEFAEASCPKQFVYPTGQVLTSMKESCFEYNYDVRTEGDYTCTSTEPISTCKPGCTTAIPYNSNVMYDCVPSDAAANTKQAVSKLPSFPKPGCHYFRKWWKMHSEGCEA